MSICNLEGNLSEFTDTGVSAVLHEGSEIPNSTASASFERHNATLPAALKHSTRSHPNMYRTRSPQKPKPEAVVGATEESLDHAIQAIREQLNALASERRVMEQQLESLTTNIHSTGMRCYFKPSFVTPKRAPVSDIPLRHTTSDKPPAYNDPVARLSLSSTSSSHESLGRTQHSPVPPRPASSTPPPPYAREPPTQGVRSRAMTSLATPETPFRSQASPTSSPRPSSLLCDSALSLPGVTSPSGLDQVDSAADEPHNASNPGLNRSLDDVKRGSTVIVRRISETGQLEHYHRKPAGKNRPASFSSRLTNQLRRPNSPPNDEESPQKFINRSSIILPGIETTV